MSESLDGLDRETRKAKTLMFNDDLGAMPVRGGNHAQTAEMPISLPNIIHDLIGGESVRPWENCENDSDTESTAKSNDSLPDLDWRRNTPFINIAFNETSVRVHLEGTSTTTELTEDVSITRAMSMFPGRPHFAIHATCIIPFDLSSDPLLSQVHFDIRADFTSQDERTVRSFFLCTLNSGLVPGPIFNEKILFIPSKVRFSVRLRKWKPEFLPGDISTGSNSAPSTGPLPPVSIASLPEVDVKPCPETEKLKTAILKLLELRCVTGSGPIKATRLRSDIKETSSNELIIAGLRDVKWTEFLKKLHDQGLLYMTSKGQENWVSLAEHDKEDCTNFSSEKKTVSNCMEQLLSNHNNLPVSEVMDRLFQHPQASSDLWKMMSPNWKTLRRILMRDDARALGIQLDACGDGCVMVTL